MKRILNTLDGWGPLILCLMYELKLENSFWKPYLDILPHMFTTPMFWDQKDLEELVGTGVIGPFAETHYHPFRAYQLTLLTI